LYFQLSDALTRRFIRELRRYWQYHPKFREIVDGIQGKYSFKERPQRGIIVKPSGGSHVTLSPDHYKGMVQSYVFQAKVRDKPGLSLEWVREDSRAIQENGGVFPTVPGVYYIDVQDGGKYAEIDSALAFFVDPLLDVYQEQVTMSDTSTGQLLNAPLTGSLRLFEQPSGFLLKEGTNYTLTQDAQGALTGEIVLTSPLTGGRWLQADYRYPGTSTGPFPLYELHANNEAVPGVILAFGRRAEAGDQVAVVVQGIRQPAALEYGGRWSISLEFDVFARDVYDQREIADQSVMYLFGVARGRLSSMGLEIMTVSLGGESEEVFDETGDDYFYNSTFSMEVETEWSIHVPLSIWLRQAAPLTQEEATLVAGMTDDELRGQHGNIQALESLGLDSVQDPFWSGEPGTFELIR